jgi:hypothetical protein
MELEMLLPRTPCWKSTTVSSNNFLYFQCHTLLFLCNLSLVVFLLELVVGPKLCSTENRIQRWRCVGHERCQLYYIVLASWVLPAAVFLSVLLHVQLANAFPSTDIRIFANRATFFCPLWCAVRNKSTCTGKYMPLNVSTLMPAEFRFRNETLIIVWCFV